MSPGVEPEPRPLKDANVPHVSNTTAFDNDEIIIGRRERAKAANRTAILAAGRATFAELGFEAATVRDIIRRTGLAAGTFYNYFRSKEEIFQALTEESAVRFGNMLREARRDSQDFETYINRLFGAFFQLMDEDNPELGVPIAARLPRVRADTPQMQALFAEICNSYEDAIARGLVPPFDAKMMTAASFGLAAELAGVMLSRTPRDIPGATAFAAHLVLHGALRSNSAESARE